MLEGIMVDSDLIWAANDEHVVRDSIRIDRAELGRSSLSEEFDLRLAGEAGVASETPIATPGHLLSSLQQRSHRAADVRVLSGRKQYAPSRLVKFRRVALVRKG